MSFERVPRHWGDGEVARNEPILKWRHRYDSPATKIAGATHRGNEANWLETSYSINTREWGGLRLKLLIRLGENAVNGTGGQTRNVSGRQRPIDFLISRLGIPPAKTFSTS